MHNSLAKQASFLTYLGILPFLICAGVINFGYEQEKAIFILRAYGAIIISFIAGIHWGVSIKDSYGKSSWLLISSNAIALLAWLSLLMHHHFSALFILALCLVLLLFVDIRLYSLGRIDFWYIRLRHIATFFVLFSFIISTVALL